MKLSKQVWVAAVLSLLAFLHSGQARVLESPFTLISTQNPDWLVLEFQGDVAAHVAAVLKFQGEITCQEDSQGLPLCRAWLSRSGDLRNAASIAPGSELLGPVYSQDGTIRCVGANLDDPDLYHYEVENGGFASFIGTARGHDLICRGTRCRWTIDFQGAIDPIWDMH